MESCGEDSCKSYFFPTLSCQFCLQKKTPLNCDPVQLVLEIFDWNQQCCKYLCSEVLENRPQAETTLLLWFAIFEDSAGSILWVRVTNSHQQGSTGGFRCYSHLGKVFFWDASLPLTSQDQHSSPRLSKCQRFSCLRLWAAAHSVTLGQQLPLFKKTNPNIPNAMKLRCLGSVLSFWSLCLQDGTQGLQGLGIPGAGGQGLAARAGQGSTAAPEPLSGEGMSLKEKENSWFGGGRVTTVTHTCANNTIKLTDSHCMCWKANTSLVLLLSAICATAETPIHRHLSCHHLLSKIFLENWEVWRSKSRAG